MTAELRPSPPTSCSQHSAKVWLRGEPVAEVVLSQDAHHLVIHQLTWTKLERPDDLDHVMRVILAPFPEQTPPRLTHHEVRGTTLLKWYQHSHLRHGVVSTGRVQGDHAPYDLLSCIRVDDTASHQTTLSWDPSLTVIGEPEDPDWATICAWLHDPNPLLGIAAIRRLGIDDTIDPKLRRAAHLYSLLHPATGIRQFAAVQLSGGADHPALHIDHEVLIALMREPSWIESQLPETSTWTARGRHDTRARRNVRYAAAWMLANLVRRRSAAVPWHASVLEHMQTHLDQALARRDPRRDDWLTGRVQEEFVDHPHHKFGFGVTEPVDLLDWLRFAVLRARLIDELHLAQNDAYSWLIRDARLITETCGARAVRDYVHRPRQDMAPPTITQLPSWMYRPSAP